MSSKNGLKNSKNLKNSKDTNDPKKKEHFRKPDGYWQVRANTKKELDDYIEELGHFPKDQELKKTYPSLGWALQMHGGINAWRQEYGLEVLRQRSGYWTKEKILVEIREVMKDEEKITFSAMHKRNASLPSLARRKFGKMADIRQAVGIPVGREIGYWKNIDNVKHAIDEIMTQNGGHFPRANEIQRTNNALFRGIYRYHSNLGNIRKIYGMKEYEKPKGYWKEWQNIKESLDKIVSDLGRFPTPTDLEAQAASLYLAIRKYHQGLPEVRRRYGATMQELSVLQEIIRESE